MVEVKEHPLRKWRVDHRMTQMQASERVGVSFMQYWRFEQGLVIPRHDQMAVIHNITGLEPNVFYAFMRSAA